MSVQQLYHCPFGTYSKAKVYSLCCNTIELFTDGGTNSTVNTNFIKLYLLRVCWYHYYFSFTHIHTYYLVYFNKKTIAFLYSNTESEKIKEGH